MVKKIVMDATFSSTCRGCGRFRRRCSKVVTSLVNISAILSPTALRVKHVPGIPNKA